MKEKIEKQRKIIIGLVIVIILLFIILAMFYSKNKMNIINTNKINSEKMTDNSRITELEKQIDGLNVEHTNYAQYIQTSKAKLATEITNKGVTTNANDELETMANNIAKIETSKGFKQVISLGEQLINHNKSVTFDLTTIEGYQNLTVDNIKLCINNFDMYFSKSGSGAVYMYAGNKGAGQKEYNQETGILTVSNLGWSTTGTGGQSAATYYTKITVECLVII